ncbi:hypothetical protein HMPREF9103_02083 [Lentilactobacillus parafarraginis F0439]|uniref:Uncharacterized protein n=1 Tax=Lentilactobacillus parafarraginis F0439 TaxID=797515 RepID=G9ZQS5_9LACO|nr:hypothetical protein HMPREF9103_02083 [Lentilactobacillus parafarraginis F0439]
MAFTVIFRRGGNFSNKKIKIRNILAAGPDFLNWRVEGCFPGQESLKPHFQVIMHDSAN